MLPSETWVPVLDHRLGPGSLNVWASTNVIVRCYIFERENESVSVFVAFAHSVHIYARAHASI